MTMRFLRELVERAVKTFAQALVAVLGAGATNLIEVPWGGALAAAGFAALLSVLTSVASAPWGDPATPSLVTEEPDVD
jgi:hypothetical protein